MRVGVLTTWNERCGLATYAAFLYAHFDHSEHVIFAPEGVEPLVPAREQRVVRCWRRAEEQRGTVCYESLLAACQREHITHLHINCHTPAFFSFPTFTEALRTLQRRGISIIVQVHSLFTTEPKLRELCKIADKLIVHGPESRLEAIGNGAPPERVVAIPHGVAAYPVRTASRRELKTELGLGLEHPLITTFGFIQPHKGMEAVIEAVSHLAARGVDARGLIIGDVNPSHPQSCEYLAEMKKLAAGVGVGDRISFLTGFMDEDHLTRYLRASDLVIMNYRSQHFEASGACAVALGSGALVATSLAPQFQHSGDAVWHMTSGYPPAISAELLFSNEELRTEIERSRDSYVERFGWAQVSKLFREVFGTIARTAEAVTEKSSRDVSGGESRLGPGTKTMRVLIQNRANSFSQPGGDTIVMERLETGLRARGVDVKVDTQGVEDPAKYDLVHLFNFTMPELTRHLAERAVAAKVPFVVTTLYEDVPSFHHQSHAVANSLMEYVGRGQDRAWLANSYPDVNAVPKSGHFDNEWVARRAAALLVTGNGEAQALRRDYPGLDNIVEVKMGREAGIEASPTLFEREFNVKDYVLCVGRIESRKNQLTLLKALEDSEITVVLAGGGFTYQPQYDEAVRRINRKGTTIIAPRLSPEMLASAYAGCRAHVLASWYELPGIVSLEAAAYGKNIVVSRSGTASDYFGDLAFYAEAHDFDSIKNAVHAAYYGPASPALAESMKKYSWNNTVEQVMSVYERIAPSKRDNSAEIEQTVAAAEKLARERRYEEAQSLLGQLEQSHPKVVRVLRARGATYLAQSRPAEAEGFFDRALAIDASDVKALTGKGMSLSLQNKPEQALPFLGQALDREATQAVALQQLMDCSYKLGRLDDVERRLTAYLAQKPQDAEMRCALANCLYKSGKFDQCGRELSQVLSSSPSHNGALELQRQLAQRPAPSQSPTQVDVPRTEQPTAINVQPYSFGSVMPQFATGAPTVSQPQVARAEPAPAPGNQPHAVGGFDAKFVELEEGKREKNYGHVRSGCTQLLANPLLTAEQRGKIRCLQAEVMVLEGLLQEAGQVYETILKDMPQSARAMCGKGALAAEGGRWVEARRLFSEALLQKPEYDVALAGMALCEMSENRAEEAWNYFYRAVKSNPENQRALLGIIQLGYPLKRYGAIEETLRGYLEMHPASIDMLYALAGAYYAQQRYDEGKAELQKILLFQPDHANAKELLQAISEQERKLGKAV